MTALKRSRRRIDLLAVHCSATMPHHDVSAADIDRWHRKRGWSGIGYHYVIRRDGTQEIGRDVDIAGAHAAGHNRNSIGICMIGGLGPDNKPAPLYTRAQWRSLKALLAELRTLYPDADVKGHRELGAPKACPSFDVAHWLATGEVVP